jgi:hypothetical protein
MRRTDLNRKFQAPWLIAFVAFVCFAPLAFGQNSVNLTLIDGGSYTMGGIYVGPYDAVQNNQPAQIICDDFQHEVSPGQSWSATVTSFSSLTNSTTGLVWSGDTAGGSMLGGTVYSLLQGYDAMAYLDSEMSLSSNKNSTQMGYLAYAVWAVFDSGAVYNWLKSQGDLSIWATVQSLAEGALKGTYTAGQFAGWEILTPICPGQGCSNGPPQEFLEYVPEGGSAPTYLLLAGFACFGAMFSRSRRLARNH